MEPGYNDIGYYDSSSIASVSYGVNYILAVNHQIIILHQNHNRL